MDDPVIPPVVPPDPADATGSYAPDYLATPTYDGSGIAVHPAVAVAPNGISWNSYKYWMAMTPFPNGDLSKENPSILASADGDTWVVPDGLTNPITAEDSYPDPHLIFDNNTLYCIFIKNLGGTGKIYLSSSADGVTWSAKAEIYSMTGTIKGPATIKIGSVFYIYYSTNQTPLTIKRISALSMAGPWDDITDVVTNIALQNSHIEAIWVPADNLIYMYDDNGQNFGLSNDGINFTFASNSLLTGTRYAWSQIMYRGSLVRTATGFDFWYSAHTNNDPAVWHIGRTTVTWSIE